MTQRTSKEVLAAVIDAAVGKAHSSARRLLLLGMLAGVLIALAGAGANMAGYLFLSDPTTAGLGRMLSGVIFPAGLILVVFTGAELFTGNNLMVAGVLERRITAGAMLRNWILVYAANLLGALAVAWLVVTSGLLETGDGLLRSVTISIAASKATLPFGQAFVRGILCNLLVCLAIWLSNTATEPVGKILGIFFPIWLFVASGYEHSVANMYFIPAGLLADGGATASLTWSNFFLGNLLPVTLGNLVGGGLLVGVLFWYVHRRS